MQDSVIDSYKYYKQFSQDLKPMSPEEEMQICKRVAAGDDAARDILILRNIYLAENIALDKVRTLSAYQLSDDLIQSAIHGLIRAAESFDVNKGVRFSTYATHAISNAVEDEFCQQTNPSHIESKFYYGVYIKVQNFCKQYAAESNGCQPGIQEVCDALDITPTQYHLAMQASAIKNYDSMERVVDNGSRDDKDITLADTIPDSDSSNFIEDVALKDTIRDALSCLSARDREVITLRFGLNGGKELSRQELASLFGMKPESINRLINQCLAKMQQHLTRDEYQKPTTRASGWDER